MKMPSEKLYWTYPCGLDTEWDLVIEKRNPLVFRYVYGVHSIPGELGLLLLKQRKRKMKIETKFELDETVYAIVDSKLVQYEIKGIKIEHGRKNNGFEPTTLIKYLVENRSTMAFESELYASPEEAAMSLVKKFNRR